MEGVQEMTWGIYNINGKLLKKFSSCASAHRWLLRNDLEWSGCEIRTLRGEWIMNPMRKEENQK
jgi:hypothetical protein